LHLACSRASRVGIGYLTRFWAHPSTQEVQRCAQNGTGRDYSESAAFLAPLRVP
jgi:hypothetical protein